MLVQLTESAGWWAGDDDSYGVEISIAGGIGEMVRAQLLGVFFFFLISCALYSTTGNKDRVQH